MKTLTEREVKEMEDAIKRTNTILVEMLEMLNKPQVDSVKLWDLRNQAGEVANILYNIHGDVYQNAVVS